MKWCFSKKVFLIALAWPLTMMSCEDRHPLPSGASAEKKTKPCRQIEMIDSLMWQQPDSAFAVLQEFVASSGADGLDEYNGHYLQLLTSELLFKNHYQQENRADLRKAMDYFDSLCRGDVSGNVSTNEVFLAARAHYMNGVGYDEHDSLVPACAEFLKTLEMMDPNQHPRFTALTYNRLVELFSNQFMQEPAIICCKRSIAFDSIEPVSRLNQCNMRLYLGKQYHKLNQYDSAKYYYDECLRMLPDTNNVVYRDFVAQNTLLRFNMGDDAEPLINDLKRLLPQINGEQEKWGRYLTIGCLYEIEGQYDSALVYLTPVFENEEDGLRRNVAASYLRNLHKSRGDTLMDNQLAAFQVDNSVTAGESNAQVSRLYELFQQHLQWEQEKAYNESRRAELEAARQRKVRGVTASIVVLLVAGLGLGCWLARRKRERDAETLALHEEKEQLQTRVDEAHQQTRAMLSQRVADLYHSKLPNRMERIGAEFEAAYPQTIDRLAATYPGLSEAERQIAILNFFHFRAKEEADLMGFAENTIMKYRSNLNKKAGPDPLSTLIKQENS